MPVRVPRHDANGEERARFVQQIPMQHDEPIPNGVRRHVQRIFLHVLFDRDRIVRGVLLFPNVDGRDHDFHVHRDFVQAGTHLQRNRIAAVQVFDGQTFEYVLHYTRIR